MEKKKLYTILIILCVLATAGILYYGMREPAIPVAEPISTNTPETPLSGAQEVGGQQQAGGPRTGNIANIPIPNQAASFTAPSVFPADPNFNLGIFQSSDFQNLQPFTPLSITQEEMGRENPFTNF